MNRISIVLIWVLLSMSPGCQAENIRKLSYENSTIKYKPVPGEDDQVIEQVVLAFIQKAGVIRNSDPITVEVLSDDWRKKCHSDEMLNRSLGEYCNAEFAVSQSYKVKYAFRSYGEYQMRFVLKMCSSGRCEYVVSDKDFSAEE